MEVKEEARRKGPPPVQRKQTSHTTLYFSGVSYSSPYFSLSSPLQKSARGTGYIACVCYSSSACVALPGYP